MKGLKEYYFEMTDTFGGELNYCWLTKFTVNAASPHGALCKISKWTGYNFKNNGLYYKAKKACIGLYELENEIDEYWIEGSEKL